MSDPLPLLAEAAFEGLAIHESGIIRETNHEFGRLLRQDPTTLPGKDLSEFVAPECRRWFAAALRPDSQPKEISFSRADGSQFHAEVRCRVLSLGDHVIHTIAVRDLTQHIAIKEELRQSQAQLEMAQTQAGLGSWVFFPESQASTWSKELFRIYRRDPSCGAPTPEEFLELVHPDDRDRVRASYAEALDGRPSATEYRTNPANGPLRYLQANVFSFRDAEGRVTQLAGTVLDISDRKSAELVREDGEERYRHLFEQAPIGIGVADITGRILDFNDAMLAPGGYEPEDIAAMGNVKKLYADPAERDRVLELLRKHGFVREHEVVFKRKDGTHYDASISLAPVTISGQPCVLAMVQDITRRKAVERALQESETRFRALTEESYDVITMFGADGMLQYISPSVTRVLGYDPEELIGKPGLELIHPDDAEEAAALFAKSLAEPGTSVEMAHRLRHADGSYRTVQIAGRNLLDEPGVNAMVSNFRDVTNQRRAESELRESEAKYRTLFEQASFGIVQAAADGSFLTVNQALVQLLGYDTAEQVLALDPRTEVYADPKELDTLIPLYQQMGSVSTTEVKWKRKNGDVVTVRLSGRLVDVHDGTAGLLMMAEDVTHQRTLEEQLVQAQKMEAVGQLTAGIAHDFNNLLTAVLGRAELLAENLSPARPDLHDDVDQIREATVRGAEMVKKLLSFSRKEGLRFESIDLAHLCHETTSMLEVMMPESLTIITQAECERCYVRADRGAVQQMLINLATNALDAMPHGGTMTIAVEPVMAEGETPSAAERALICLSVSDTGIGMDEVTKEKIFDPFFTTKVVGEGTGLGLSMIYGMVKQHGGWIDVASALGQGTSVSLYFPACQPESPRPTPAAAQESRGGSETILVVEDNEPIRRVAARVLEGVGYEVRLASDGEEALAILENEGQKIDLVITDVVMPKLGGAELHQRALELGCNAPFIFTSGYSVVTHANLHENAHLTPLLNKPWSTEDLKRCVRETLDGHIPTATAF